MRPILEVKNISKRFSIENQQPYLSLRDKLMNAWKPSSKAADFWALKDVSFEVNPGDSIGIIGRNGAGKSTLLKILSRITPPTAGTIICRGRVASLLEVGTGFHAELTGRENVYLNGSILGMKRREIDSKFDAIVDFAGTEQFLDTPLKHYSSGMQLRLAFAVAAFLEPEILVIDEVLAVGDAEFQKKCMLKMEDVSRSGRTILFVSHDLGAIATLCTVVCVIQHGKLSYHGGTMNGITAYQQSYRNDDTFMAADLKNRKPIFIKKIQGCDETGNPSSNFVRDQPIAFDFEIVINEPSLRCDLFVMVLDSRKRRVFALEANELRSKMRMVLEPGQLVRGGYSLTAYINQPNIARIDEVNDVCSFNVIDNGSNMLKHGDFDYGSVFGRAKWIY